jgi:multicomponent Na+:H+ antiporter subunit E
MRKHSRWVRAGGVVLWSVVVWSALWSDFSVANAIWGVVAGVLTLALVPVRRPSGDVVVRPLLLLWFVLRSVWALVRASAVVAWEVVTPRNRIHEAIVAAPLRTTSPGVITLIANVITLTPGTVTLEVHEDPPTLYIHILHLRTVEEVRQDIRDLEDLAMRALPGVANPIEERP